MSSHADPFSLCPNYWITLSPALYSPTLCVQTIGTHSHLHSTRQLSVSKLLEHTLTCTLLANSLCPNYWNTLTCTLLANSLSISGLLITSSYPTLSFVSLLRNFSRTSSQAHSLIFPQYCLPQVFATNNCIDTVITPSHRHFTACRLNTLLYSTHFS